MYGVRGCAYYLVGGRDEGDFRFGRWQQNQPSQVF
jgi:hypothetical protein